MRHENRDALEARIAVAREAEATATERAKSLDREIGPAMAEDAPDLEGVDNLQKDRDAALREAERHRLAAEALEVRRPQAARQDAEVRIEEITGALVEYQERTARGVARLVKALGELEDAAREAAGPDMTDRAWPLICQARELAKAHGIQLELPQPSVVGPNAEKALVEVYHAVCEWIGTARKVFTH